MNKQVLILVVTSLFSFHSEANDSLLSEAVKTLSSKEYEGRRPGTPGNEKATAYLINKIKSFLREILDPMVKIGSQFSGGVGGVGAFQLGGQILHQV